MNQLKPFIMRKLVFAALAGVFILSSGFSAIEDIEVLNNNDTEDIVISIESDDCGSAMAYSIDELNSLNYEEDCELTATISITVSVAIEADVYVASGSGEVSVTVSATFSGTCEEVYAAMEGFANRVRSIAEGAAK